MSSRLQLDMRNLSPGRRHLVNACEVNAGIGVIAGNTVWSMPERLECEVLQKARYINTLTFTFTYVQNESENSRMIKHRIIKTNNSTQNSIIDWHHKMRWDESQVK